MERITKFRVGVLLLIIALVLGFYAVKLFQVQIIETDGNTDNITTFTTMTRVKAARGAIMDRNGNVLVGNRASYDIIINHFVLVSSATPNQSLYDLVKLCEELGIEYNEHFPVTKTRPFTYTLDEQNSAWRGYFQTYLAEQGELDSDITAPLLIKQLRSDYNIPEQWTDEEARKVIGLRYELRLRGLTTLPTYVFLNDATDEQLSAILETNVPGLNVEASTVRECYTGYAAHVLGYVGPMSEEQWDYYKDKGYSMDAEIGQNGLEQAFEEELHGTDGWRIDVVTADGTIIKSYYEDDEPPKAGNNVEITIDLNIQEVSEDALADAMKELRNQTNTKADGKDCEGAAVVVMEAKTGNVLAMGSYPTFDLRTFQEDYEKIINTDFAPMYNRALNAVYPPGSTFKMSTLIAAIDSGKWDADQEVLDTGVFDKYYKDTGMRYFCSTYTSTGGATDGMVDAAKGLTVSCNVYFYTLADSLDINEIDNVSKHLGLGEPTGIELTEDIGHRANPEVKKELHGEADGYWYVGDRILTGIGQSENAFTPLQLCVYTATVANQGTRYAATLLNRVVSDDYRTLITENTPRILDHMDVSDEAYYAILKGMNGVVNSREGTAFESFNESNYFDNPVCPYNDIICAKTGTAEHGSGGSDHGSFVLFAPMNDPEIVIAVVGEKVGHGYAMAKVARTILEYYFSMDNSVTGGSGLDVYENRPC